MPILIASVGVTFRLPFSGHQKMFMRFGVLGLEIVPEAGRNAEDHFQLGCRVGAYGLFACKNPVKALRCQAKSLRQ